MHLSLIHFPCLKPRCRVCTALYTSHNWASPPFHFHFLNNLKFATSPCNKNVFVLAFVTFNFLFVLLFVFVFISKLHPLCRGYERLFKASLLKTTVGSIKFIPLEKMYHRSNRASIGKTSKWHHRMSWLFLYLGHRRTQLCLICDPGSDYMVTTTTKGRTITSSCGSLPTRSWSTKMVMFRPPPCKFTMVMSTMVTFKPPPGRPWCWVGLSSSSSTPRGTGCSTARHGTMFLSSSSPPPGGKSR